MNDYSGKFVPSDSHFQDSIQAINLTCPPPSSMICVLRRSRASNDSRTINSLFVVYIYIIFLTNLFDLVECKRSKLVKCNNFHETCATIIIHSLPPQFIYFTLSSSTYPQCLQYRYYLHYISTSVCSPNIRDNRNLFSRNDSHIFFGDPSIQYL